MTTRYFVQTSKVLNLNEIILGQLVVLPISWHFYIMVYVLLNLRIRCIYRNFAVVYINVGQEPQIEPGRNVLLLRWTRIVSNFLSFNVHLFSVYFCVLNAVGPRWLVLGLCKGYSIYHTPLFGANSFTFIHFIWILRMLASPRRILPFAKFLFGDCIDQLLILLIDCEFLRSNKTIAVPGTSALYC